MLNLYYIIISALVLIVILNYYYLKNPKPYPPEHIRERLKNGSGKFSDYKYIGFSQYSIPKLIRSEYNWINGFSYWYKFSVNMGLLGIIIMFLTMNLEKKLKLNIGILNQTGTIGVIIFAVYGSISLLLVSNRIDKYILKD